MILKKAVGINTPIDCSFNNLELINTETENTLSFLDNEKYINQMVNNKYITGCFIIKEFLKKISVRDKVFIVCDDPRYCFFSLYNYLAQINYRKKDTIIDKTARIHPKASISDYNVKIGKNVRIDANAVIYPDVYIGDECVLCAGCVLGCEGFELKKTKKGILSVMHDGKLIINNNVFIGANTTIYKGFSFRDTVINENTKIDNLVYIAHAVHIGADCLIVGSAMISGSTTIGKNVWVGPGATI